jgi:hypothetical protein
MAQRPPGGCNVSLSVVKPCETAVSTQVIAPETSGLTSFEDGAAAS